jgi:hypothetical protein
MIQDITRYIEIIGKGNLKKNLKEELTLAIKQDNWQKELQIFKICTI